MDKPKYEERFQVAIAEWRARHRLRDDDAALLLMELFLIHQQHWDELRRSELPSFQQFRTDITRISEAARTFQQQVGVLLERLPHAPVSAHCGVSLAVAAFAAALAAFAGYLLGRAWP